MGGLVWPSFAQIFEQGLIHGLYAVRVVDGSHISYPSDT
jgi:hypothetical protein